MIRRVTDNRWFQFTVLFMLTFLVISVSLFAYLELTKPHVDNCGDPVPIPGEPGAAVFHCTLTDGTDVTITVVDDEEPQEIPEVEVSSE